MCRPSLELILVVAASLSSLAACGNDSGSKPDGDTGGSAGAGAVPTNTGGSAAASTGGVLPTGGAGALNTGGSAASSTGGDLVGSGGLGSGGLLTGGTGGLDTGGTGGDPATGGSDPTGGVGNVGGGPPLVYDDENTGEDCPAPPLPSFNELASVEALPDPFEWSDGSGRISSVADWRCRRAEIGAEIQNYEAGQKPTHPATLEASYSGGTLSVTVGDGGSTIQLTASITMPSGGSGPYPALIGVSGFGGGAGSLDNSVFTERGIALISYNYDQVAGQNTVRGQGGFWQVYPNHPAGAFTAWAWGVSRIIDGLELAPEANIDVRRLGMTGCSFAGKIALFAGAFDERIALTIPQESGGGGVATWRVSDWLASQGGDVEQLSRAQGVDWWLASLSDYNNAVPTLPYDHHELMAMVAPRALFVLGNPDMEYLASESGYVGSRATHEVYDALGIPDRFGFSQVGGHGHCEFPSSQRADLAAFVDKFLVGDEGANTDVTISQYDTDLGGWITWDTPMLE